MAKTVQFATKCKGNTIMALKQQISFWQDSAPTMLARPYQRSHVGVENPKLNANAFFRCSVTRNKQPIFYVTCLC